MKGVEAKSFCGFQQALCPAGSLARVGRPESSETDPECTIALEEKSAALEFGDRGER